MATKKSKRSAAAKPLRPHASTHADWQATIRHAFREVDEIEMERLHTHRHSSAYHAPRAGFESALVGFVNALGEYVDAHERSLGSPLAQDGEMMGDEWRTIARSVIGLLNGESGRLDCGALERAVRDLAERAGFTRDLQDL